MSEFVVGIVFIFLCLILASIILFKAYDGAEYEEISDNVSLEFEDEDF